LSFEATLGDVQFQQVRLDDLWETEVHDLVQDLVNQDKVLPYMVLIKITKVRFANRNDLVQELKDQSSISISLRSSNQRNTIMGDVNEVNATHVHNWLFGGFLSSHNLCAELNYLASVNIAAVASVDKNLTTCIDKQKGRCHF
jgi:hypothetical protein